MGVMAQAKVPVGVFVAVLVPVGAGVLVAMMVRGALGPRVPLLIPALTIKVVWITPEARGDKTYFTLSGMAADPGKLKVEPKVVVAMRVLPCHNWTWVISVAKFPLKSAKPLKVVGVGIPPGPQPVPPTMVKLSPTTVVPPVTGLAGRELTV